MEVVCIYVQSFWGGSHSGGMQMQAVCHVYYGTQAPLPSSPAFLSPMLASPLSLRSCLEEAGVPRQESAVGTFRS